VRVGAGVDGGLLKHEKHNKNSVMAIHDGTNQHSCVEKEPQTSSKKIIQGAHALARLNIVRTSCSLAPTYLFKSSGP
jgi:hypothetical protein